MVLILRTRSTIGPIRRYSLYYMGSLRLCKSGDLCARKRPAGLVSSAGDKSIQNIDFPTFSRIGLQSGSLGTFALPVTRVRVGGGWIGEISLDLTPWMFISVKIGVLVPLYFKAYITLSCRLGTPAGICVYGAYISRVPGFGFLYIRTR